MSYTDILNSLQEKKSSIKEDINNTLETIIELDGTKFLYDETIKKLDIDVLSSLSNVNSGISSVENAYTNRINVGCRTDMFWRLVGINTAVSPNQYTITVTKLSPTGYSSIVGFGTTTISVFNGVGFTTYSTSDTFGLQTKNYYGVKYYDAPYTKDIEDTFITSFIGRISIGSSILTVLSPVGSSSTIAIKTGQFVQSSKSGVLPPSSNIVSISQTTTAYPVDSLGIGNTTLVTELTLDTLASGDALSPESDGSFVTFTVLKSVDEFNYSLADYEELSTKNPTSPQTIGILSDTIAGIGVSIKLDNNGGTTNPQSWYPELEDIEGDLEFLIPPTLEPDVGPGVSYYTLGFSYYPTAFAGAATTVRAAVGFTTVVLASQFSGITTTYGSSCPTLDTEINNLLSNLSSSESTFNSNLSNINLKVDAANALRRERSNIQSSIWNYRQTIAQDNLELYQIEQTINYLGISTITNLL